MIYENTCLFLNKLQFFQRLGIRFELSVRRVWTTRVRRDYRQSPSLGRVASFLCFNMSEVRLAFPLYAHLSAFTLLLMAGEATHTTKSLAAVLTYGGIPVQTIHDELVVVITGDIIQ